MPVLIEAYSVVTRKDRIEACYPGGVDGFFQDCPNRTACADDHLVRVGFMDAQAVGEFIATLQAAGLIYLDANGYAQDLVVVTQGQGPKAPCEWAEVFTVNLSGCEVDVCRLAGTDDRRLACPGWWRPEKALKSPLVRMSPEEQAARMEFLREENGLMVCRDRVTGKVMYSAAAPGHRPGQEVQPDAGSPTPSRPSIWQTLLSLFRGR
jgi:hypothetical protein